MNQQALPKLRHEPSPAMLFFFYVIMSLAVMIMDFRWKKMDEIRSWASTVVQPAQVIVQAPVRWLDDLSDYFMDIHHLRSEVELYKKSKIDLAASALRSEYLETENEHLRRLLSLKQNKMIDGQVARILSSVRDPSIRRVVIDKGRQHQVKNGVAVVDDKGLIGQVTRSSELVSEVTLITDKHQAIPVQVARTGLRTVLYGLGDGTMELRFLPANIDLRPDDLLVTSGLDEVYLPGLPVARVSKLNRDPSYIFAKVTCIPVGGVENNNIVMVLTQEKETTKPFLLPSGELGDSASERYDAVQIGKTEQKPEQKLVLPSVSVQKGDLVAPAKSGQDTKTVVPQKPAKPAIKDSKPRSEATDKTGQKTGQNP